MEDNEFYQPIIIVGSDATLRFVICPNCVLVPTVSFAVIIQVTLQLHWIKVEI